MAEGFPLITIVLRFYLRLNIFICLKSKLVLTSLKRSLKEKEQTLSVMEEDRSSMHQEITTLRSRVKESASAHLQARRELQELRTQVEAFFFFLRQ